MKPGIGDARIEAGFSFMPRSASRRDFELDNPLRLILDDEFGPCWPIDLPTGALIGMVNVVDCQPTRCPSGDAAASDDDRKCGDFAPGRFAWKRAEFRLFDPPILYRGAQGIFNVPDELIPKRRDANLGR
jgi:hypothetical protein